MRKQNNVKISVGRRDFVKTASIAGVAVTIPGKNLFRQYQETTNGWYEKLVNRGLAKQRRPNWASLLY